jgi:hypothetical protein
MKLYIRPEGTSLLIPGLIVVILIGAWPGYAQTPRPAITRDIDNPDRQELYAVSGSATVPNGRISESWCSDAVPAGKRLVVENLAAHSTHSIVDPMLAIFRGREGSAERNYAYLPLSPSATTTGGTYHVATLRVQIRLAAGIAPCFIALRTSSYSGDVRFWFTVSGYLVDAP